MVKTKLMRLKHIKGYSIDFDVTITNPFDIKAIILEGTLVKRGYSTGHTVAESFKKIKRNTGIYLKREQKSIIIKIPIVKYSYLRLITFEM